MSIPEQVCRRRRILAFMYERCSRGYRLLHADAIAEATGSDVRTTVADLSALAYVGMVREPSGLKVQGDVLLTEQAIADGQSGLIRIELEPTDEGVCLGILKILRRARATATAHPEAGGAFSVRGGPLRTLGIHYEDVFDYLDVLADLQAIDLGRILNEVSHIQLLAAGTRASMACSLDAPQAREGGAVGHSIRFGDNAQIGAVGVAGHQVIQTVQLGSDHAELRRLLGDLTGAIHGLDRSVKDRVVALTVAQHVASAANAPNRDPEELADHWIWLGRFADSVAAADAPGEPATIPVLYQQASPLIEQLIRPANN